MPYGYLLVALKSDQDERYRLTLSTNAFPGRCSTCMFTSKVIDMLGIQWMVIYVNINVGLHCGEWIRMLFLASGLIMAKSCRVDLDIRDVYFRSRDVGMTGFVYHVDMFQNV